MSRKRRSKFAGGRISVVRLLIFIAISAIWCYIGWNVLGVIEFPWILRIIWIPIVELVIMCAIGTKNRARRIAIYTFYSMIILVAWWFFVRWALYLLDFPKIARYGILVIGIISTIVAYWREVKKDDDSYWKTIGIVGGCCTVVWLIINSIIFSY